MSDALRDPALRRAVREQLLRELVLRTLLHDVRGALTAALGWVELMGLDGNGPPKGLERSLEGIRAATGRYEGLVWGDTPSVEAFPLAAEVLGFELHGLIRPEVDALRLVAALEIVRPTRVRLFVDEDAPTVYVARVEGVSAEASALALSPHPDDLLPRMHVHDQVLGCCLLREVGRSGRAELRRREAGTIDLLVPA